MESRGKMTLSQNFAICPWCGAEDSTWPDYYVKGGDKPIRISLKRVCDHCKKQYLAILTVAFYKSPVCEHDKAQFGDYIEHPLCCFETRKII